mmetsp:Transcript_61555/g.145532  ORF Transcript_61555/g.145532 Transcript_61555/m.145532 type:complete len:242 (-) Transcript_61555:675-1400(-)
MLLRFRGRRHVETNDLFTIISRKLVRFTPTLLTIRCWPTAHLALLLFCFLCGRDLVDEHVAHRPRLAARLVKSVLEVVGEVMQRFVGGERQLVRFRPAEVELLRVGCSGRRRPDDGCLHTHSILLRHTSPLIPNHKLGVVCEVHARVALGQSVHRQDVVRLIILATLPTADNAHTRRHVGVVAHVLPFLLRLSSRDLSLLLLRLLSLSLLLLGLRYLLFLLIQRLSHRELALPSLHHVLPL